MYNFRPGDRRYSNREINIVGGSTGSIIAPPAGHDPRKSTDDIVYVNINIYNANQTKSIPMELQPITRTQPIVNRASDYYCSVVRFEIPRLGIPFFNFPDPSNVRQFYITFSDGTIDTTQQLTFIPAGILTGVEQPVFFVNQFLKSINDGFRLCNAQALLDGVVGVTANPPIILMRGDNRLQILVDQAASFQLWLNWDLYNYVQGIFGYFNGYNNTDFKDEQIYYDPADTGILNNRVTFDGVDYYAAIQEYEAFYTWLDLAGLLLTSSTLPALPEYTQGVDQSGNNTTFNILTDFIPSLDDPVPDNSPFIYTAKNYRLIDLKGDSPITKIDIKAYYIDKFNIVKELYLPPNTAFSAKLMFVKKSLYDNEYGGNYGSPLPILGS